MGREWRVRYLRRNPIHAINELIVFQADTAVPNVDAAPVVCRYDGQVLFRGGWGEFHSGFPHFFVFWCGLVGKVLENVQDDVSGGVVLVGFVPHRAGSAVSALQRTCFVCVRG